MNKVQFHWFVVLAVLAGNLPCGAQHRALTPAWNDFNAGDYNGASKLADKCIDDYAITANKMEGDLEAAHVALPPTGQVPPEQKNEILSRGPLNDAAACYFIKGRSAQHLKRNKDAILAYAAGCKLKYARVWDPNGWFWDPTQEMCARLAEVKSKTTN